MASSQDSPSLQAAAELLVKAAVDQTHATSIALSKEAVGEMNRVAASTQATSEKLDKLDKLDQLDKLDAVLNELGKLDQSAKLDDVLKAVADGNKTALIQTLQWAVDHTSHTSTGHGEFDFRDLQSYKKSSKVVAREVIECFLRGEGMWISNDYVLHNEPTNEQSREAFRVQLSRHIHTLTGVKPRIVKQMNGGKEQWVIYRV